MARWGFTVTAGSALAITFALPLPGAARADAPPLPPPLTDDGMAGVGSGRGGGLADCRAGRRAGHDPRTDRARCIRPDHGDGLTLAGLERSDARIVACEEAVGHEHDLLLTASR
ncbi:MULTISPECIES: hypothetical protein [Streptomyces]|uniref:hypothetical protein n=1 Tax=Streptomyces TaxID=1883 RepID=UPI000F77F22F|nr:hypothetical protein [Streptomyces sp. WAC05858]RSS40962.1 hypothetical protein EF902_23800 [Streptomyces sp. WAC05858]WTA84151.1 hypothetical protein OG751_32105 [Streptomyces antimycoticus]WTB05414.1 hypothetical protein OG546_15035 [Streptomyces antimycoticus]